MAKFYPYTYLFKLELLSKLSMNTIERLMDSTTYTHRLSIKAARFEQEYDVKMETANPRDEFIKKYKNERHIS